MLKVWGAKDSISHVLVAISFILNALPSKGSIFKGPILGRRPGSIFEVLVAIFEVQISTF